MDGVREGMERFIENIFGWLPALVGAIAIIIIGMIVASIIAKLTRKALEKTRLDERMHSGKGGNIIQKAVPSPVALIKNIVYWVIMIGVISLAVSVLGIPALTAFVAAIYSYLPRVIAALLIFLVAGAVSTAASSFAGRVMGDTPTGKIIMVGIPVVVMGVASFMILNQLDIAPAIVTITYAAIMGSLALGLALAFGLGGRDVAQKILNDTYSQVQAEAPHIKRDLKKGKAESARVTQKAGEKVESASRGEEIRMRDIR